MKLLKFIIFCLLFMTAQASETRLKVVTTTPDLAWLVQQIGKDLVEVESLLNGSEDPHFVDVVPSFISKVMNADIVCSIGLDLEIGWLPRVIARSARSHLQAGGSGVCIASHNVEVLERLEGRVDRSMGDVHSAGNPHFTLGPSFMGQAGKSILDLLIRNRPLQEQVLKKNYQDLLQKLEALKAELSAKLSPLREKILLMEYHKDFSYFFYDYQMKSFGALEEVPGVPPSAGRIAGRASEARQNGIKLILASHVSPTRVLNRFSSISEAKSIQVPTMMSVNAPFNDYFHLQRWLVDEILRHVD